MSEDNLAASPNRKFTGATLFWCALGIGLLSVVLFPGIAPWLCDEPALVINALKANSRGELAAKGLTGTFQFAYGPFPTWCYQIALYFSHNIYWLLEIHAIVFYTATALSLAWLGYELKLNRWYVLSVVLSPAICFYSRQLWDNSFNIPLSILLLATYARLLNHPSVRLGIACGALMVLMLTVHLSSIPLVLAVLLHLLIFAEWKLKKLIGYMAIGGVAVSGIFIKYFISQIDVARHWNPTQLEEHIETIPFSESFDRIMRWESPIFTLSGSRVLTADFAKMPRSQVQWMQSYQLYLGLAQKVIYGIFALGLIGYFNRIRNSGFRKLSVIGDHLLTVSVIGLLLQMLMFGVMRVLAADHYFNGIFAVYPLIIWMGLDHLGKSLASGLIALLCISSVSLTALMIGHLCQNHGNQQSYGPVIDESIGVYSRLRQLNKSLVVTDIPHLYSFPQAMQCFSGLTRDDPAENPQPLFVSWRDKSSGYIVEIPASVMEKKQLAYSFDVSLKRSVYMQNQ